jgi:hypothetical protein
MWRIAIDTCCVERHLSLWLLVCGQEETSCRTYIFELLRLIQQPLCLDPRHAAYEADCSISWHVRVCRVVQGSGMPAWCRCERLWQMACLQRPVNCLLQARRVLRAKLRFRQVDAWLGIPTNRSFACRRYLASCFFACCLDMPDCDRMLKPVGAARRAARGGGVGRARPTGKVLCKTGGG